MNRYHAEVVLSWQEVHRDARQLAAQLLDQGEWKGIVVITRGGMMPAAIIARELELRLVETLCLASYQGQERGALQLLKGVELADEGAGWLVIDDLADTGQTLALVQKMLPRAHIACLYVKPEGQGVVHSYVQAVSQETWIRFPWDLEMHYATPLAEQRHRV